MNAAFILLAASQFSAVNNFQVVYGGAYDIKLSGCAQGCGMIDAPTSNVSYGAVLIGSELWSERQLRTTAGSTSITIAALSGRFYIMGSFA